MTHSEASLELSGSVVECLTRDRGATGSSLTGVIALCPCTRHINPSLVLLKPRKTRPYITERLLMGRKESNKQIKQNIEESISLDFHSVCLGYKLSSCCYSLSEQQIFLMRQVQFDGQAG